MRKTKARDSRLSYSVSKAHVWYVKSDNVDACRRCGSSYYRPGGGQGAFYCYPTPQWLNEHPEDDHATHISDAGERVRGL